MAAFHPFFLMSIGALVVASGHPFLHNKRHSSEQDTSRCRVELDEELCSSGYIQDLADLAVRCNQPTAAAINGCGRNNNGMLCNAIDTDAIREDAQSAGCEFSSTTCTPECRIRLMSIRDELDCCFSFHHDSSSGSFDRTLFDNRLWSSCDIHGSAQECTSTIVLNEIPIDPNCTQSVFQYDYFFNINCRREYIEPLIARMSAVEGCENYITEDSYESCNTNRFGTHCDNIIADISDNYTAANQNCNDNSTCDPLCLETLNNISRTSGCCFNEEYNNTAVRFNWLSYKFYSTCGLESPGLCPLGISIPDSTSAAISISAANIVLIISVMLTFTMQ